MHPTRNDFLMEFHMAEFFIIGKFEGSLAKIATLAAFIPVIMGMGGNIGTQSSTIIVRGIATGRIDIRDFWSVLFKELAIGVILGVIYGLIIGAVAQVRYSMAALAFSVGLAVISSMSVAALVMGLVHGAVRTAAEAVGAASLNESVADLNGLGYEVIQLKELGVYTIGLLCAVGVLLFCLPGEDESEDAEVTRRHLRQRYADEPGQSLLSGYRLHQARSRPIR